MIEFLTELPLWFVMMIISAVTLTFVIILARADRIKAGPIEIDCGEEDAKSKHGDQIQAVSQSGVQTEPANTVIPANACRTDCKE